MNRRSRNETTLASTIAAERDRALADLTIAKVEARRANDRTAKATTAIAELIKRLRLTPELSAEIRKKDRVEALEVILEKDWRFAK